jgi:serine phosphatase RsbU (regulator of sigma subunit)/PAS domain-containing protein
VKQRPPDLPDTETEIAAEIAGVRSRGGELRRAASLPGANARQLLDAALDELDAALDALTRSRSAAAEPTQDDPPDALYAERRLLHAVFQQAPVPLFLLGQDGSVRRVNAAAGDLLGSGPGYATGKLFTAFVDMPSRAAVQTQLAAAARTGKSRQLRCGLLAAKGVADCALTVRPVTIRGDSDQLIVAVGTRARGSASSGAITGTARASAAAGKGTPAGDGGSAGKEALAGNGTRPDEDPDVGVVVGITRRLDLVIAATRILLENVTYSEPVTLQRFARLLSHELAAWVIVDVERNHRLQRQLAVGPEDQQAAETARVLAAVDPVPGSAPHQVHQSGSSLLVSHVEDQSLLGDGPDGVPLLMLLDARSVLCVPLSDGEISYGVLTLARQADQGHFGLADVGLVEALAEQLALAIRVERMFRHRSEIADALAASLLPRKLRQIPGTEIAAAHVAATDDQAVGADFYDVYPAHGGWGIAIGDICGRGQDSAAVTAAARHAIRALAHTNPQPAAVLRQVNELMLAEEFGGRFVTAVAGQLRWGDRTLRLALGSAGHPAPVLIRPDGRTQVLQGGGLPLGIFADAEPATEEIELEAGDTLFLFTDGLSSACGPDMVTFEDRLADELAALAGEPPPVVVSRVQELVLEFCRGELRDDITILALRVGEPPDS